MRHLARCLKAFIEVCLRPEVSVILIKVSRISGGRPINTAKSISTSRGVFIVLRFDVQIKGSFVVLKRQAPCYGIAVLESRVGAIGEAAVGGSRR